MAGKKRKTGEFSLDTTNVEELSRFRTAYHNITLPQLQDDRELAVSLVVVAFSLKKEEEFFRFLFESDIQQKKDPIFREENRSIVCLRALFEVLHGKEAVTSLLQTALTSSAQLFQPEEGSPTNSKLITEAVDGILETFENSVLGLEEKPEGKEKTFLSLFGWVFGILKSVLDSVSGIAQPALTLISSIFFLRFVTPILCDPYGNGLVPEPRNSFVFRRFIQLGKTLQAVANDRKDYQLSNISLSEMNDFVETSHQRTLSLASSLVLLPFSAPPDLPQASASFSLMEVRCNKPYVRSPRPSPGRSPRPSPGRSPRPSTCHSPRPSPPQPSFPSTLLSPFVGVVVFCFVVALFVKASENSPID